VGCLGEQLAGGLLPQDKLLAVSGGQLVGWIGLAESELGRLVLVHLQGCDRARDHAPASHLMGSSELAHSGQYTAPVTECQ
jgi:hypothetical protein